MIAREELIKKYPKAVLGSDESDELSLFFGTDIEDSLYTYDLFYVNKLYDTNETFYMDHENLPSFESDFNYYCERFVNFDVNMLKKEVLKYISSKLEDGEVFSSIKKKIIADALVKNGLDDEKFEDYDLSQLDLFDVIVSDSAFSKMIEKSFVFDQKKYENTKTRNNLIETYKSIKNFIDDEIEDATKEKDEVRIKELKFYQKFFDKLLLTRINCPKKVVLNKKYLDKIVEYKKEDICVSDLIPDDIKKDFINKINTNIHISLDDIYKAIQDYRKEEEFFEPLAYEEDEMINNNEFANSFVDICLSVCKKKDGKSYKREEVLNYLLKILSFFKKWRDFELDSFLYEESLSRYDDYDDYDDNKSYDEDYYYNGYKKER